MNTIEQFNEHVMPTYGRFDVVMEQGRNQNAIDENGKSYIDFGSGIGTNSLGYCNDQWVEAVCNQVKSLQHHSNYYYSKVQADFAEKLAEMTGFPRCFSETAAPKPTNVQSSLQENTALTSTARADTRLLLLSTVFTEEHSAHFPQRDRIVFTTTFFPL